MQAPVFAIGDIQGCFNALQKLITQIDEYCQGKHLAQAELWLVGDLVNRGSGSLDVLRWCTANRGRVKAVLGNHDLHLLAVAAGIQRVRADDTLAAVLAAPDCDQLLRWLRQQPLARLRHGWLMVHAGLLPQWTAKHAVELSKEFSSGLSGQDWQKFLSSMYGNEPNRWSANLRGDERRRVIINGLTRLRFCSEAGNMEFATKEGSAKAPAGYAPWFSLNSRLSRDDKLVFGHWSTLGLINQPKLIATDTGCVWGGLLTAVQIDDDPSKRVILQASEF